MSTLKSRNKKDGEEHVNTQSRVKVLTLKRSNRPTDQAMAH